MEEGTQQIMPAAFTFQRGFNRETKLLDVSGSVIGKIDTFAMTPDLLNGIEFRSVRRQPFNPDGSLLPADVVLKDTCSMDVPAVHNEDDPSTGMFLNALEKTKHVFGSNIMSLNVEEKLDMLTLAGYTKTTDDREPIMLLGLVMDGGLAFNRPAFSQNALQHKAGFVKNKNVFFSPFWPISLSSASPSCATLGPFVYPVLLPCAGVSDSSTLEHAGFSRHERDGRLCRSVPRLLWQYGEASRVGLCSRELLSPEEAVPEAFVFPLQTYGRADADEAEPLKLPRLLEPLSTSSELPKNERSLPCGRLPSLSNPALRGIVPSVFELPNPVDFLWVACIILYISSVRKASVNRRYWKEDKCIYSSKAHF